ncbi:MAG TPA: helix-turn-helix transcriptional regulator, partial [Jiangellales bacterium]|nr:helix-turn-helix transcriptional regulator [Jiangellales bacterium]
RSTGAPDVAARLGELALRLTPDDDMTAKVGRALAAAADLALCGDVQAAAALLAPLLPRLPRGPLHARVEAALVWLGEGSQAEGRDRLRAAADEAAGDAGAEASVRYWLARTLLNTATLSEAEVQLRRVAALSAQVGDARLAVTAARELCFVVMARGEVADIDALAGASTALAGWDADCYDHPDLVLGWAACWSDDLERADELIGGLVGRADRSGQPATAAALRAHLAEVRIRQGRFAEAELLARAAQPMCEASGAEQLNLYVLGHALAHLGRHEQAEAAAGRGAAICRREGDRIFLMQNLLVLGFLAVSTRRWDDAARTLSQARELALRDGYRHPGLFRWDGDLAEALVAAGRAEDAEAVDEDLAARAQALGLEVPLAVAWRSEALRLAATGEPNAALRAARDAVAGLDPRRAPFDAARAQLVLGTVERRCRHRAAARRALAAALAEFSRMGAVAWAARAGEELGRVAGGAAGRELSDTERRVCALAAAGSRNREIAAELFISEKTVEAHLSSAYRKLGVRSRAQLARRLPPDPAPPAGSR